MLDFRAGGLRDPADSRSPLPMIQPAFVFYGHAAMLAASFRAACATAKFPRDHSHAGRWISLDYSCTLRSRSAFATETELKVIAALAMIGLRTKNQKSGERMPATLPSAIKPFYGDRPWGVNAYLRLAWSTASPTTSALPCARQIRSSAGESDRDAERENSDHQNPVDRTGRSIQVKTKIVSCALALVAFALAHDEPKRKPVTITGMLWIQAAT